jgi:hypothetical protein
MSVPIQRREPIRDQDTDFRGRLEGADPKTEAARSPCRPCAVHYATTASPFFSTSDNSLSEGPEGRFSPRSHLLTRLLVTFR